MDRRNLLRGLSAIGLGSVIPWRETTARDPKKPGNSSVCWLTPQETEGPYYFNPNLIRQDVRTDFDTGTFHTGLQLNMLFTVIDIDCNPIPNVLVDIWHTNKDGLYSGYVQPGGNTVGQDFMRGIQATDINGQCSFITSYPGWYPGRATHVHFKVRLSSTTYVTSQFCFLDSVNNAVYATPLYSGRGPNPTTNASDGIFGNPDPPYQRMTATANGSGGYDGTFAIGISGATGVKDPDPGTPDKYWLGQNYPNPFNPATTIRYNIPTATLVKLIVYDVLGREVVTLVNEKKPAGTHDVVFNAANVQSGFYFYKIVAGDFVTAKEMLLLK